MNITTLLLATMSAVAVSTASEPTPAIEPLEPTLLMLDEGELSYITAEEYIARTVMHEMPYTFEPEALKAQAVAARSYLYYCLENGYHSHEAADVCSDINHCMGYITKDEYAARYGDSCAQKAYSAAASAAKSTRGEVLTYDGEIILSVWHASSEGFTEDSGDVWLTSLPYLASVSSPEDAEVSEVSFTMSEVKSILMCAGYKFSGIFPLRQTATASDRCDTLTLGVLTLDAGTVRTLFSLKSTDFTAFYRSGRLIFTVHGYGHGVGLSQHGANALAKLGYDYREILAHYYTGAVIE